MATEENNVMSDMDAVIELIGMLAKITSEMKDELIDLDKRISLNEVRLNELLNKV